jgi:hypothetical protein
MLNTNKGRSNLGLSMLENSLLFLLHVEHRHRNAGVFGMSFKLNHRLPFLIGLFASGHMPIHTENIKESKKTIFLQFIFSEE